MTLYATQSGDTWFGDTNTAYLVFLVIAIMGFWTVPSIANYIMHAGTMGSLMQKVNIQSRSIVQPVINAWMGEKITVTISSQKTRTSMDTVTKLKKALDYMQKANELIE